MNIRPLLPLAVFAAFAWTQHEPASIRPIPKQLAGPPAEFLSGVMRQTDPADVGVRSRSALLPVQLTQDNDGAWQWRGDAWVDWDGVLSLMVFSPEGQTWELDLRGPAAKKAVPAAELLTEYRFDTLGMGENQAPGVKYRFDELTPGRWTLSIRAPEPSPKPQTEQADGFVLIGGAGSYRLYSHLTTRRMLVGAEVGVIAYAYDHDLQSQGPAPAPATGILSRVRARIAAPSGALIELTMHDDGRHGDGAPADGVYGALFTPVETGSYQAQTLAEGLTPENKAFTRTAEHAFPVIAPEIDLAAAEAQTATLSQKRIRIDVPVAAFADAGGKYRAFAEVWGMNAEGVMKPAAWVGGMVYLENGAVSFGLDARWLGRARVAPPLELRNLTLEDVDTHIPHLTVDQLPIQAKALPAAAYRFSKTIDEEMLMGPRPPRTAANKAGGKLLLVHGYCSSDVWGPVSGQFSNAAVFQDFGKNRSHDQFALQILSFGAAYSSYGIVAHSQGGAASLHLYTYYWSGLDYASGGRLIQSVGTPYQGTSLAGNLAALGGIFGVGCGTNTDLTYNGASAWLSGIPSWARNAVNYYTTSFRDRWWAYDYCQIASDLLLSDPDDGTVEKAKGQLSSGVNRGHKQGWCHTSSMRDPAQYTDSGRNATMSANAAR